MRLGGKELHLWEGMVTYPRLCCTMATQLSVLLRRHVAPGMTKRYKVQQLILSDPCRAAVLQYPIPRTVIVPQAIIGYGG